MKLKETLFIYTIGEAKVGKTTTLAFLVDIFWDAGIQDIKHLSKWDKAEIEKIDKAKGPQIILVDNVNDPARCKLVRQSRSIGIRVRSGNACLHEDKNVALYNGTMVADLFLTNSGDFRFLTMQLKDLVKNEMPNLKAWKEAITI